MRVSSSAMLGVMLLCMLVNGPMLASQPVRGFGYGGAMGMALLPDTARVDAFLLERGLPPVGPALVGAGGGGRGGVIGGFAAGGVGWGLWAESGDAGRRADWVFAGGGLDVGVAVGGNERSVLTLGTVLGGGASVLSLAVVAKANASQIKGIVPAPDTQAMGVAIGFIQPYVSMAVQLLPWMELELRIGTVQPWLTVPFGDPLNLSAASLSPKGFTVSLGLAFGGIASMGLRSLRSEPDQEPSAEISSGLLVVDQEGELRVENLLGDVHIVALAPHASQTPSRVVEWKATRVAPRQHLSAPAVVTETQVTATSLRSEGRGRVDYELRVPAGVDIVVRSGTGHITLDGHGALTVILETGVGEIRVLSTRASILMTSVGIGSISLTDVEADTLIADVGVGDIHVSLRPATSAQLLAKAGLGNIGIDRFPAMTGGVRGLIGKSAYVTLGQGRGNIELNVGIGNIDVAMYLPVSSME